MTESPTVVTPDAADRKPRSAPAPVTDPEAPYGWIKDKTTGQTRPKLRPGKQTKTEAAPRERVTNKTRSTTTSKPAANTAKHSKAVASLTEGVWMLLAAVPPVDVKIPGTKITVKDVSTRTKAQAEILSDNAQSFGQGLVMMADHSAPVSKFLLKADSDNSPVWVIPCMMAMLPFVVQSAAMWNTPLDERVAELADRTTMRLDALLHSMTPQPEGSRDDQPSPNGSGPLPTTEAHSYS